MRANLLFWRWLALLALLAIAPVVGLRAADPDAPAMTAKIEGRDWIATRELAVSFKLGGKPSLNVTAFLQGTKTSRFGFNIVLPADGDYLHDFDLMPGVTVSHGSFNADQDADNPMEALFTFQSGKFTITKYDAATQTVSGRFSGSVTNVPKTRTLTITDGSFANIPVQGQ